jgi:hypothetical protein
MSGGAAQCRGCGARIRWITTVNNKHMPVDPDKLSEWVTDEPATPGAVRITLTDAAGRTSQGYMASVITPGSRNIEGYTAHFSTCPKAKGFKR